MIKQYPTLYSRTSTGAVQIWYMEQDRDCFRAVSGQKDGVHTVGAWTTCKGKNIGKANETNPEDQCGKEIEAKYKKRLERGYFKDEKDIDNMAYIEVMLAKKFLEEEEKLTYPVAYEPKLNGVCCCREVRGAYSRNGKYFYCINHIVADTDFVFQKFPKAMLHGELFNWQYKNLLNEIASLVSVNRKPSDVTPADEARAKSIVRFYVYDGYGFKDEKYGDITEQTPFWQRKQALKRLLANRTYVEVLDFRKADSRDILIKVLKETKARKEEGIMVKVIDGIYEHKRSDQILKLKNFESAEFEIVDFLDGKGKAKGILWKVVCRLKKPHTQTGETTFESNMRGSMAVRKKLFEEKHKYIGGQCTVDFQEYSEYGVPLIPYTGLPFRDYE